MANDKQEVVVTDIKIPFWSMVVLLVKWAIAAIPALIILMMIAGALSFVLGMFPEFNWHWGSGRISM